MIRQYKAPLLKKRALDALLETMTTDDYQSLGGHGADKHNVPYTDPIGGTGVNKGTEFPPTENDVVIPSKDLVQSSHLPSGAPVEEELKEHEFFKESDPASKLSWDEHPELRPVEKEIKEHAWFKESEPEFEMSASGIRLVAKESAEWGVIQNFLAAHDYKWAGLVSDGTEMWTKKNQQLIYDPASRTWSHRVGGVVGLQGDVEELQSKITAYDLDQPTPKVSADQTEADIKPGTLAPGEPYCDACDRLKKNCICDGCTCSENKNRKNAAPKCPHCGSTDYGLMPTDFETAKCNKCGKNWNHGIVPGINDPKTAAVVLPTLKTEDLRAIGKGEMTVDEWKKKEPTTADAFEAALSKIAGKNVLDPGAGKYDFEHEAHVRDEMKTWAQYAEAPDNTDKIKPFDPEGKYLCGTCDMRKGSDKCMRVEGGISFEKGSCRLYHIGEPETAPAMKHPFSKEEVKYGEHEGGFSCKRCEYGGEAAAADPDGREGWCSFWGTHVETDACCSEWDKDEEKDKKEREKLEKENKEVEAIQKAAAAKKLYHATRTEKVPSIRKKGILPLQTSNWVKGPEGERYGQGEIFAMDNPADAVRWAAKMDWEFNVGMGTGKISIVSFTPGKEKWELDTSDPLSQAANQGHWLKAIGSVKPEQIVGATPVTSELVKSVVQNKSIKLADVVSYGMGQPLGGTGNPTGGPDDENADEDENTELNMTSALEIDSCTMVAALTKIASTADTAWWAKSARPTEQKIQLLQKQFGVTPQQVELCIEADPSPQQKDYVATIAKWLSKGQLRLPEDTAKLKQQLTLFEKLKKSPKFVGNKDIQQYDPAALYKTVEENQTAISKKEQERQKVIQGASVIVQDGDLMIYRVTETPALIQLSGGTNWCTAHKSHADRYLAQGPSYVFFKYGSAFAQLHPPSDQLMDRTDVGMVESIESEGKTIAKFISNPTALRGLQLLAQQAPDVAAWVKENATDQAQLVEILGKKMEEEAGKGTETREMAVQWAMAKGQPLGPAEEAKLPSRVTLDLLSKYGVRFHGGKPWEPLEKAVLASKETLREVTEYALEFVKGRWLKGEQKLLRSAFATTGGETYSMKMAMREVVRYAQIVIKGRWLQLEKKFHTAAPTSTNGWGAAKYAIEILKQRWKDVPGIKPRADGKWNEEVIIMSSPAEANLYAKEFMPGELWQEFTDKMADEAGLSPDDFRPDHDLWVVREWNNLRDCIRSIGTGDADDAMDYALGETAYGTDVPDDDDMVDEVVENLSYTAMRRIGQSLQEEAGDVLQRWAKQQGIQQIDFTDEQQLKSALLFVNRYAPDCSVWKNIREAYRVSNEQNYREHRIDDLSYELTNGMYERNEDTYTELRFGPNFDSNWDNNWKIGPVFEVLDRDGAVRMMQDGGKDISEGQLELWLDENPDYSDDDHGDEVAFEMMNRWYTEGLPREKDPNQMQLQFRSSLLKKKKALVDMHESPTMLPPRDDMKRHLDEDEQDEAMVGVLDGIIQPQQKRPPKPKQIDPRIKGAAAKVKWKVDSAPVGKYRSFERRCWPSAEYADSRAAVMILCEDEYVPRLVKEGKHAPLTVYVADWNIAPEDRAKKGAFVWRKLKSTFPTLKEAQIAAAKVIDEHPELHPEKPATPETSKQADYDEQLENENEYFLEQVQDAKNEAKRHFMEENYLLQEAQERGMAMEQLWKEIGEEYTAEFYGYSFNPPKTETSEPVPHTSSACPLCKSARVREIPDDTKGYTSTMVLAECQDCHGFYSLLTR